MLTPDFEVSDLKDRIIIKVFFKGHSAAKCDVVVTDMYAKFNLNPYLLVINFPELVSITNVIASASGQELKVHIGKVEPEKWTQKYPWDLPDKATIKKRQEESLERLIEHDRQVAAKKKQEEEATIKQNMEKSWEVEKEQRKTLQEAIEEERKYAEDILAGKYVVDDLKDKPLYESAQVAPTRSRQKCVTTHTPLFKNIPARYDGPNRRFINPQKGDMSARWMKQSGDTFFKDGAYTSAINAYTKAIESSDRQYCQAFSNRALARIKLGYYEFALADCNDGLSLIHDPIPSAEIALAKVRLLSRKTYCLYQLGRYVEAFQSCAEITKYMQKEATINEDLKQIALLAGDKIKGIKIEKPDPANMPVIKQLDSNGNETVVTEEQIDEENRKAEEAKVTEVKN